MHGPINFKSPNNTSKWQMGFNSVFKGLMNFFPAAVMCRGLIIHLYCPRDFSWPGSLYYRPVYDLWWTELHGTGFSPITSVLACQYFLKHARCLRVEST
jgi:hypothetical protein